MTLPKGFNIIVGTVQSFQGCITIESLAPWVAPMVIYIQPHSGLPGDDFYEFRGDDVCIIN